MPVVTTYNMQLFLECLYFRRIRLVAAPLVVVGLSAALTCCNAASIASPDPARYPRLATTRSISNF